MCVVCVRACIRVTIQCIRYLAHMNNVYVHYITCSTTVVLIWQLVDFASVTKLDLLPESKYITHVNMHMAYASLQYELFLYVQ